MKKVFKNICRMTQREVKSYGYEELSKTHDKVIVGDGFVYAEGNFPVLLVAHMDTVHKKLPKKISDVEGIISSANGIGGDDRCGIYMVLQIVKKVNCSVLFCEDEEIGAVGAEKFINTSLAQDLVGKFNYIMEFDRKGDKDAVFYECDNPDFEKFITKEYYKSAYGSFSDISTLAPFLEVAAVNLSCGYYQAHTKNEYVVWDEMQTSIGKAIKILNRTTDEDKFKYIPAPITLHGNYSYDYGYYGYGAFCYEVYYMAHNGDYKVYETLADTELEAIALFCMEHPDLTYNHIVETVCLDDM